IQLYADLRHGNVAHPGDGYLDQLIRYQDFAERDDVLIYDMDMYNGARGIAAFEKILGARLEAIRARLILNRGANLVGRLDARRSGFLLVGEAPSPRSAGYASPDWPWCDRDDRVSSATWLNQAIHRLALREDRLSFTNADGDFNYLPELLWDQPQLRVIALGDVAYRRVTKLGGTATRVGHPQHHRRFHHGDGPAGYARILREAMT
ncbi:MAG TPA: hypothetical protein VNN79_24145, partial [Actinomycetota bacterium]|nr:hypothetical protein [Actinomycetota bacterium]